MKQPTLLLLLIVILSILSTVNILTPIKIIEPDTDTETIIHQEEILKEAEALILSYEKEAEKLKQQNDSLKQAADSAETTLLKTRRKAFVLQRKVSELSSLVEAEEDTVIKLAYCDTLQLEASLMAETFSKEISQCDSVISELKQINELSEAMLATSDLTIVELDKTLKIALGQQDLLEAELKKSKKRLRWSNTKNGLLSAGVLILTGITTTIAIQK